MTTMAFHDISLVGVKMTLSKLKALITFIFCFYGIMILHNSAKNKNTV